MPDTDPDTYWRTRHAQPLCGWPDTDTDPDPERTDCCRPHGHRGPHASCPEALADAEGVCGHALVGRGW